MHTLTADEQSLLELVRGYVVAELHADDGSHGFTRERFAQLAAMDLTSLPFAPEDGGVALPLRTTAVVVEELARASSAVGAGLASHLVGGLTLQAAGVEGFDSPAREHYRRLVLGEETVAVAIADGRTSGRGPLLRRDGDRVFLDGTVEGAVIPEGAERLITTACDDAGVPHLLVIAIAGHEIDAPTSETADVEVSDPAFDPMRWPMPITDVVFEYAELPGEVVVATGTRAESAVQTSTDAAFLLAAACAVGIGFAAIDDVVHAADVGDRQWAMTVPDGRFGETLADMVARTEAARSLSRSAAERRDHARGIGPHRHGPEAGSGYRFRRAAAAAWLTAHTTAAHDIQDLERLLRPTTASASAAERGSRTLRCLTALAGSGAAARQAISDDVRPGRGPR